MAKLVCSCPCKSEISAPFGSMCFSFRAVGINYGPGAGNKAQALFLWI